MIAVVDHRIERGIVIGAAAPAGLRRAFEQHDLASLFGKRNGGGQAGQAAADDIIYGGLVGRRGNAHPNKPWRSTMASSLGFDSETRVRGGAQPTASVWRRISS